MALSRFIAIFSPKPEQLFEVAHMLSPRVEVCPPDGVVLEVPVRCEQDTLDRLPYLIAEKNFRVGGAATRTAAIFVAKVSPGTILPYGKETEFLEQLPIQHLSIHADVDAHTLSTLSHWGVKTFGEFASLPEKELVARLGQRGVFLQKIARGEDAKCLQAYQPEVEFKEVQDLEWTLNTLEPLFFIAGGMLENLCSQLKGCGLAMGALQIKLNLSDGSCDERNINLALPMQDAKAILSLLRIELQTCVPRAGVVGVLIQAKPARPRIFQHSLLQPTAPHPEKLSQTLTRLKAIVGNDNVGCPELLDTYRPDAFQMRELELERKVKRKGKSGRQGAGKGSSESSAAITASVRLSLRRMRPPQPIQIDTERITSCAGPWKSSGDWWMEQGRTDGWSREEWDVELTDGGLYRIYWDHGKKQWFVEGVYD